VLFPATRNYTEIYSHDTANAGGSTPTVSGTSQ